MRKTSKMPLVRRSRVFHALPGCAALSGLLLAVSLASAQTSAENVAAARALGVEGIRLAEAGNCEAAIEKLERAEALYHAPTTLARLGECQIALGKIVLGTETLYRVVREALPPNAPRVFVEAQERARRVLEASLPKIAQLTVAVEPSNAEASVTVDGTPLPSVLLGASRPTDPGQHEVQASAPGYLPATQTVVLTEGARERITLSLQPDPNAAPKPTTSPPPATDPRLGGAPGTGTATPPSSASSSPPADQPHDAGVGSGRRTTAYVLLGVGGAGILAGSVFGVLALGKKADLDEQCASDGRCGPGEPQDTLDTANGFAMVSTIGFGVGLVSAGVGAVLLLTDKRAPSDQPAAVHVGRLTASPWVGLGSAGVTGTF